MDELTEFREGLLARQILEMRQELRVLRVFPFVAAISVLISAVAVSVVGVCYLRGPKVVVRTGEGEVQPAWLVADEQERQHFILIFLNRMFENDPRTIHFKITEALNMMDGDLAKATLARLRDHQFANQVEQTQSVTILNPQKIESLPFQGGYAFRVTAVKKIQLPNEKENISSVQYRVKVRNTPRDMRNYWLGLEVTYFEEEFLVQN